MISFELLDNQNLEFFLKNELFKNNKINTVFQNLNWIIESEKIYFKSEEKKVFYILIKKNNIPVIFLPLCLKKFFGCKVLNFISSEAIDKNNLILLDKNTKLNKKEFKNIWIKIINQINPDLIYLEKIIYNNDNLNFFFENNGFIIDKNFSLITKKKNFDKFYNFKNSSKSINTDKRKLKKLKNLGLIEFEKIDLNFSNLSILKNLIDEKFKFYSDNNKKTFNNKKLFNFYSKIIEKKINNFVIFNMSLNSKIISSVMGVLENDIFYYLIPLIKNEKYRNLSLGRLHLMHIIKSLYNNQVNIDFGTGNVRYKKEWSNQENLIFNYLKLNNIKGLFHYIYLKFYLWIKKYYLNNK